MHNEGMTSSYTMPDKATQQDDNSTWEQKSALLSLFSQQMEQGLDNSSLFKTLEDLYHIEPFSVLQAVAYTPKSLKIFSSFLAKNPSYQKSIVNSYNWDERFSVYGSLNAGILMVKESRADLLRYCVKHGLFVEWQDHRGKNLLFYVCQPESKSQILLSSSSTKAVKDAKKETKILNYLLGLKQSKALLEKKDWSGRTAYDAFCENREIILHRYPQNNLKEIFQEWDSMWQKKILSQSLDVADKAKPQPRKI